MKTQTTCRFALAAAFFVGGSATLFAADHQGQSITSGETISGSTLTSRVTTVNGTKLDQETRNFSGNNVSGSVTSYVYNDDQNNPYGLNDLTFKYVIDIDPGSLNDRGMATFANDFSWGSILTSVGENNVHDGGTGGDLANSVSDSSGIITWSWNPALTSTTDGGMSCDIIIETDATAYENAHDAFDITAGPRNTDPGVAAFVAIPDGGMTAGLMGGALMTLQAFRRRMAAAK